MSGVRDEESTKPCPYNKILVMISVFITALFVCSPSSDSSLACDHKKAFIFIQSGPAVPSERRGGEWRISFIIFQFYFSFFGFTYSSSLHSTWFHKELCILYLSVRMKYKNLNKHFQFAKMFPHFWKFYNLWGWLLWKINKNHILSCLKHYRRLYH